MENEDVFVLIYGFDLDKMPKLPINGKINHNISTILADDFDNNFTEYLDDNHGNSRYFIGEKIVWISTNDCVFKKHKKFFKKIKKYNIHYRKSINEKIDRIIDRLKSQKTIGVANYTNSDFDKVISYFTELKDIEPDNFSISRCP